MLTVSYADLTSFQQNEVLDFYRKELTSFDGRRRYFHWLFDELVGNFFGKESSLNMTYEVYDKNGKINLYVTVSANNKKALKELFRLVYPDISPNQRGNLPVKKLKSLWISLLENDPFVTPCPKDGVTIFADRFLSVEVTEDIARVFGQFYRNILDELTLALECLNADIESVIVDRIKDDSFVVTGDLVLLPAIPKEKEETERNDYLD